MKQVRILVSTVLLSVAVGATMAHAAKTHPAKTHAAHPGHAAKTVTTKDGLKYQDIVVGKGARPRPGQTVTVDYVGTLTNGKKFDASRDHGGPFSFTIG